MFLMQHDYSTQISVLYCHVQYDKFTACIAKKKKKQYNVPKIKHLLLGKLYLPENCNET